MAHPVEEFEQYRDELFEAIGDDDPLEVLRDGIQQVRDLTETIPWDRLREPAGPGEWSAQQVLSHLADTDLVYGVRIRMIVTQDKPALPGYDQEAWTHRFAHLEESGQQTFLRWRVVRQANLRCYSSLSKQEWDMVGLHSERGEESARMIVKMLAGHDRIHIRQMAKALGG